MKRGEQKPVPVPPDTHHRQYIFGAYNWVNHTVCTTLSDHADTSAFLTFLEYLLVSTYPDQPVVLVLDNASYHKAAAVRAFFSLVEHRVLVIFLPAYCSHLNPIERFWRFVKDTACANTLFPDFATVMALVAQLLRQQNDLSHAHRFAFSKLDL
jgi:transposase